MERAISVLGIAVIFGLAWLWSTDKKSIPWRTILWGLGLQFLIGITVVAYPPGARLFASIGEAVTWFLGFANDGAQFLFGKISAEEEQTVFGFQFALTIMPIMVFVASVTAVLYHIGFIQRVVGAMAWVMKKSMRVSAIESLSASANVFLGQTEAPLIVRHYIQGASKQELFTLMVGGFATIAGSTMGVYIAMGIPANYLIIASLLAAPGGLALAKLAYPNAGKYDSTTPVLASGQKAGNVVDAIARGALDGFKIAVNVIVVLLAFKAIVALLDASLAWGAIQFSEAGVAGFPSSIDVILGWVFLPLAWLTGVPAHEAHALGSLLGVKISQTEFLAYEKLSVLVASEQLSERTITIASVALCGFANVMSIGIQIGGFGIMAPDRRSDVAIMGFKAMCIGALANLLAACIVGVLV